MAGAIPCGGSWGNSFSIVVEGTSDKHADPLSFVRQECLMQGQQARMQLQRWVAETNCKPGCEKIVVWRDNMQVRTETRHTSSGKTIVVGILDIGVDIFCGRSSMDPAFAATIPRRVC